MCQPSIGRWPQSISRTGHNAGSVMSVMTGVFPRRSTFIFRETLAVISLALMLGLLISALTALAPRRAWPQTTMDPAAGAAEAWPAGLFFRSGRSDALLEAPSLKTDVVIRITGEVARTQVRQRFVNPADVWLEGVYVFPLPEGSAVDRLIMEVGDRRIAGRILPRKEAEAVYKQAAAEGRKASLLSSERPNVFVTSVANVGPGEAITVEIEYQDRALYRDGRFELRFPMTVAPRYTPGGGETPLVSAPQPTPAAQPTLQPIDHGPTHLLPDPNDAPGRDLFGPVRKPGGPRQNRLSLAVHLDAGLPLAEVESLYHAVTVEPESDSRRIVTLAEGSVPANRDFVLAWTPRTGAAPKASLFAEEVDDETYLAVTLVPPRLAGGSAEAGAAGTGAPTAGKVARELILIVDTSGSMQGPSLDQAKRALLLALDRLDADDRFDVIRFDSVTEALFDQPRPADPANLLKAAAYVASFRADGGTEMRPALDLALKQPKSAEHLRQIVFLTDGAVGNETELFATIAARLDDARLFTVGLGSAPNGYFMRKAAEVGRGSATFIGKPEQVAGRMELLFRQLEHPAVTDLAVRWPDNAAADALPDPLPDLYAGEPVVVAARLPVGIAGPVALTGRIAGQPWRAELTLNPHDDVAAGIPALWAGRKVEALDDSLRAGAQPDAVRQAIVQVALRHNLVTRHTSLVAVDVTPVRPETAPLAGGPMPTNLPKGWDYAANFGGASLSLPQTATPAALLMITGAALLAMAGFILVVARRRRTAVEE